MASGKWHLRASTFQKYLGEHAPRPPSNSLPGFREYGSQQVKTLASHFYADEPDEEAKVEQLSAEWEKFKYDLASWKQEIPQEVKGSHSTTTTEWCLTRLITLKTFYSLVFPAIVPIAEVCLSMPVSNAWPERGSSALKRVKTRLRSKLNVEMLQALLAITINGPQVGQCESVIAAAVENWESQKKRRKLPRQKAIGQQATSDTPIAHPTDVQPETTNTAVQTDGTVDDMLHDAVATLNYADAIMAEVELASAALKLAPHPPCFHGDNFESGIDSDSDFDSDGETF